MPGKHQRIEQKREDLYMLEGPWPRTISCFALIHHACLRSQSVPIDVFSSVSSKQPLCFIHGDDHVPKSG